MWRPVFAGLVFALNAAAQWQLGGAIGYGVYRNGAIDAPAGKAIAGIRNRFVAGAVLTEDLYDYVSGEIRYTYHDGDPFLSAGGRQANVQGQSHSFHYDVLFHTRPREARVRPFIAAGAGIKLFVVSGLPPLVQPFAQIATLTTNDTVRPLITAGGGVKWRLRDRVILRLDFRDYITPFPKKLFAASPFATRRGIFQQFTPMVGVSYGF